MWSAPSLSLLTGPPWPRVVVLIWVPFIGQIELFYHLNCVQKNDWSQIELLVLHSNIWNHLTVCKQIGPGFFNMSTTSYLFTNYIYIYSYPQTDYFVVSEIFSVTRMVRCFKLGSKPGWFYVNLISYPRAIVILSISKIIFYTYLFTYMYWSTQFLRRIIAFQLKWQPANFPLEKEPIYCHPQTDCFVLSPVLI